MTTLWSTLIACDCFRRAFLRPPILYKYPDANPKTVKNIATQMLTNERLYIKVCHLMNLLSLEPPFQEDFLATETFLKSEDLIKVFVFS